MEDKDIMFLKKWDKKRKKGKVSFIVRPCIIYAIVLLIFLCFKYIYSTISLEEVISLYIPISLAYITSMTLSLLKKWNQNESKYSAIYARTKY